MSLNIKTKGAYAYCPFCDKEYGNGISVVHFNIIEMCNCPGMIQHRKMEKMQQEINELKNNESWKQKL